MGMQLTTEGVSWIYGNESVRQYRRTVEHELNMAVQREIGAERQVDMIGKSYWDPLYKRWLASTPEEKAARVAARQFDLAVAREKVAVLLAESKRVARAW